MNKYECGLSLMLLVLVGMIPGVRSRAAESRIITRVAPEFLYGEWCGFSSTKKFWWLALHTNNTGRGVFVPDRQRAVLFDIADWRIDGSKLSILAKAEDTDPDIPLKITGEYGLGELVLTVTTTNTTFPIRLDRKADWELGTRLLNERLSRR